MIFAIHILPFTLPLFYLITAFSQPPHPPVVRSIQPRAGTFYLPNGLPAPSITPSRTVKTLDLACSYLDNLYMQMIAVARRENGPLTDSASLRLGSFELTFRADEASLSWSLIENFCQKMLDDVRRGRPIEYEAVLTHDYFQPWVIWVRLRFVGKE